MARDLSPLIQWRHRLAQRPPTHTIRRLLPLTAGIVATAVAAGTKTKTETETEILSRLGRGARAPIPNDVVGATTIPLIPLIPPPIPITPGASLLSSIKSRSLFFWLLQFLSALCIWLCQFFVLILRFVLDKVKCGVEFLRERLRFDYLLVQS